MGEPSRLNDSIESALKLGDGVLLLLLEDRDATFVSGSGEKAWTEELISEHLSCEDCGISISPPEPRNFSFNSPYGACPVCSGIGSLQVMDPAKVVDDETATLRHGAVPAWRRGAHRLIIYYNHMLKCIATHYGVPRMMDTPWRDLPDHVRHVLLYGSGDEVIDFSFYMRGKRHEMKKPFEGILANLQRRSHDSEFESVRDRLMELTMRKTCPACHGARLNPESLAVEIGGASIYDFNCMSVTAALDFLAKLKLTAVQDKIAAELLKEIRSRLTFLKNVGLGYLSLSRESGTLSGGEAQRIRLATQLGCGLVGVIYVSRQLSVFIIKWCCC